MRRAARAVALVFAVQLAPLAAAGQGVPPGYRAVAAEQGLASAVLFAVALAESGRPLGTPPVLRPWPWTLNVAGQGRVYPSRVEAFTDLTRLLGAGETAVDVGLMQVSWRYHRRRLGTPWQALDPYHNLRVGAAILRECIKSRAGTWAGVGCYHAPADPGRAAAYRQRVERGWRRLEAAG